MIGEPAVGHVLPYRWNQATAATMAARVVIRNAAKITIAAKLERLLSFRVGGSSSGLRAIRHRATAATRRASTPSSAIK